MRILAIGLLAWMSVSSFAAPEQLLKATTSWDGGEIFYPKGDAEITSIILRLEPGQKSKFHCHPIPTLGYVLKGELDVETKDGKKVRLKKGDAAIEVMRTVHRGIAIDGPVEILVFYAGATDMPTTVLPNTEAGKTYCH
ncbi:MAG: cupin domain-containing protein [Pseudomonadales bacterium]|nr:cupin domain-containing protein [Pseudomonadales bacterium]